MPIDASKFIPATPLNSGVVGTHLAAVHEACKRANTFLFLRPSTSATMRLIGAGFATKSMDVHDKSSDWGLTSGLVPCDPAFSKTCSGKPQEGAHFHAHGQAQPIHLSLGGGKYAALKSQNHFEHLAETAPPGGVDAAGRYLHFHCPRKQADVNFAMDKVSGKVWWYRRSLGTALVEGSSAVPVMVWGYGGTPVTGDYDMWMVAPHLTQIAGKTAIHSVKDAHGRSAASAFVSSFVGQLNAACGRVQKPVFNHGAEAQNVSFTQAMDRYLVLFTPGSMRPILFPRLVLPGVLHDLLLHGYVAVRNPKWLSGVTLGIEDMAEAAAEFPDDPGVKGGMKAMDALKKSVLGHLSGQGDGTAWQARLAQLRFFRAIGRTPDVVQVPDRLMLPDSALPAFGPGSDADTRAEAQRVAREAERSFGRTGFIREGGHVSPVDQTRSGPSVSALRQFWEAQGRR
jgi:hypothetical protein